jgi:hypothetical protein
MALLFVLFLRAVIGKMEMLLGVEDNGVINLISYVACLVNFMDLQLGVEDQHRRKSS